jgi:hypothetical protein
MAILTVGIGRQFATIASAVNASLSGDTINVDAGLYTNDFFTIRHDLTIQTVGGFARLVATIPPPDGKAYITEGAAGIHVTLSGLDVSGVAVADHNGAAVRYEGGSLSLIDDYFHDNQEGLLGAPDPNGSISIDQSEFGFNGDGSGSTHDIYVGAIATFTLTHSYVHDAVVGHEVKSRAASNVIQGNRIFDNNGNASYSVDLPNGGAATITGNVIEQGPNSPNQNIFAYGEEGLVAGRSNAVSLSGNVIVNDRSGGVGVLNPTGVGLTSFAGNSVFNLGNPLGGTVLTARPVLDLSRIGFISSGPTVPPAPPPAPTPPPPPPPPPPLPLTLDQYHALVGAEFSAYATTHPAVWLNSSALSAIVSELTSTSVLTTPVSGDLWSPR